MNVVGGLYWPRDNRSIRIGNSEGTQTNLYGNRIQRDGKSVANTKQRLSIEVEFRQKEGTTFLKLNSHVC